MPDEKKPRRIFKRLTSLVIKTVLFIPLYFLNKRNRKIEEITVYSAHPSFFLWVLIAAGFVCAAVVDTIPKLSNIGSWFYIWVLFYFILTLLYDLNLKKLFLWTGVLAIIWLSSKHIEHLRNVALLGAVVDYLRSLKPKLDVGTVTVVSWLLFFPWVGSLFYMFFNGRKRFTPNEIGEFHFGDGNELTDRTGLRFRTKYRDILETMGTFGGGDLLAIDNHNNVIKQWNNIIGLYFFWPQLDRILHQRAAVIDDGVENHE